MQLPFLKNISLTWGSSLLFVFALALIVSLAVQYGIAASFPMGGDAPAYIGNLKIILSGGSGFLAILANTWYPAMYVVLAPAAALSFIDWPTRYIWWMILGQIVVGLSIWRLVSGLGGKTSAAIAMALWGLTPIGLTSFYEDGTLAQLWSLVWLVLFIDSFVRSRKTGLIVFGIAALTSHPLTAGFLIISMIACWPLIAIFKGAVTTIQKRALTYIIIGSLCLAASAFLFNPNNTRAGIFSLSFNPEQSPYTKELLFGSFLPWTLLAIPGFFLLTGRPGRKPASVLLLAALWLVAWLFATNDYIGVGLWTTRLSPYLTLLMIFYAAYAFPRLVKRIMPHTVSQVLFITIILGVGAIGRWHENARIYQFYESPSRYLRTSTEEIEAMNYLALNLPSDSIILASKANRHTEWIRAVTDFTYIEVEEKELQRRLKNQDLATNEYIILLTRREKVPVDLLQEHPEAVLFKNQGAVILKSTTL